MVGSMKGPEQPSHVTLRVHIWNNTFIPWFFYSTTGNWQKRNRVVSCSPSLTTESSGHSTGTARKSQPSQNHKKPDPGGGSRDFELKWLRAGDEFCIIALGPAAAADVT